MMTRALTVLGIASFLIVPASVAFEEEGHFHLTYLAARVAGFRPDDALQIASACQAADESAGSDPYPRQGDVKRMLAAQVNVHSFRGPAGNVHSVLGPRGEAEILERMDVLSQRATQTKDLDRLGVYLHFLGDYNAHQHDGQHLAAGFGQGACMVELRGHGEKSEKIKTEALRDFAQSAAGRKPLLASAAIQRFVNQAEPDSHWVDHLESRSETTERLFRQLYYQTRKFADATRYPVESHRISEAKAKQVIAHLSSYIQQVNYQHESGQEFGDVLNNYLANQGVKNLTVPHYRDRLVNVMIDSEGNPSKRPQLTAADLASLKAIPEARGPQADHARDVELFQVASNAHTVVGSPLPPNVQTQVDAAGQEKGVRIQYDSAALKDAISAVPNTPQIAPDAAADDLIQRVNSNSDALAVRIDDNLAAISLTKLHNESSLPEARNLGGLERIIGYVVDPIKDDIIMIGTIGRPLLNIDDLSLTLRQVWQAGQTPLCSLDPKPGQQLDAGFISRVEGVPRDSRLGRIMLDADYSMKRVNMGLDDLALANFRSLYDYQIEAATMGSLEGVLEKDHLSRFWFTPIQPRKGDIHVSSGGRLVLFSSHIQLLTEVMLMAEDGWIGTHKTNPAEEKACLEFTRRYQEIAAKRRDFAELQAFFDVTLMAGLLRQHVPSCGILALLASRPVALTPLDDTKYGVLRRNLNGRPFVVGGVHLEFSNVRQVVSILNPDTSLRALARQFMNPVAADQLISPRTGLLQGAIKDFWVAQGQIEAGDMAAAFATLTKAEDQLTHIIDTESDSLSAYLLRAFVRITRRANLEGAISDCNTVILTRPGLSRAYLYKASALSILGQGNRDASEREHFFRQARNSVDQAINLRPDDDLALGTRGSLLQVDALRNAGPLFIYDFAKPGITVGHLSDNSLQLLAQSEVDLQKAEENCEDPATRISWRSLKGWTKALRGDPVGARSDFHAGIAENDTLSLIYRAGADLLALQYDSAERYATRAIERSRQNISKAFELRSIARFARANYRGAREDLEASLRIEPNQPDLVSILQTMKNKQ